MNYTQKEERKKSYLFIYYNILKNIIPPKTKTNRPSRFDFRPGKCFPERESDLKLTSHWPLSPPPAGVAGQRPPGRQSSMFDGPRLIKKLPSPSRPPPQNPVIVATA